MFSLDPAPCFEAVSEPFQKHPLWCTHIVDPKSARQFFGLSLSKMGRALGAALSDPNGRRGLPYSRVSVWHFEHGRHITPDTLEAYRRVIALLVSQATEGRLTVKAQFFTRSWKFCAFANCACGRPFQPKRINQTRCPRCRSKDQ